MTADTAHLLATGMRRQIRNDGSEAVSAIVRYVLRERRSVRALATALQAADRTVLPDWFAVGNGIRCFARMRLDGPRGGVVACVRRANERRAAEWLRGRVAHIPWADVRFDLADVWTAMSRRTAGSGAHLARAGRLSRSLRDRHGQFAAARAIELLFYYERIGRMLEDARCRVAVMSSYTNPWGIALNLAARRRGIPVVHVMHGAPVSPLPPLDYAVVVANDPATADVLRDAGCGIGRVVVKGARDRLRPMPRSLPGGGLRAALCLSKEPVESEVLSWIRALLATDGVRSVVVRPHPANLWRAVADALRDFPADRVSLSRATLDEDLSRCDVLVAGSSSVHLEALVAGVPAVHAARIDHTPESALSFLRDGLVYAVERPAPLQLERMAAFYDRAEWRARLARYVDIERSEAEADAEIREAIDELLRGEPR